MTMQQKIETMRQSDIKRIATNDTKGLKDPKYPQNKTYRESYKKGLKNQEETINKRIQELDIIIDTKTGAPKTRAETEKIAKSNDLKKLEELIVEMKSEQKQN